MHAAGGLGFGHLTPKQDSIITSSVDLATNLESHASTNGAAPVARTLTQRDNPWRLASNETVGYVILL